MADNVIRVHFVKTEVMPFQLRHDVMETHSSEIKSIKKGMKIAKIKRRKKPSKDVLKMSYEDFLMFTSNIQQNEEVHCDFVHSTHFGKVLDLILCVSEVSRYTLVV